MTFFRPCEQSVRPFCFFCSFPTPLICAEIRRVAKPMKLQNSSYTYSGWLYYNIGYQLCNVFLCFEDRGRIHEKTHNLYQTCNWLAASLLEQACLQDLFALIVCQLVDKLLQASSRLPTSLMNKLVYLVTSCSNNLLSWCYNLTK